jgi:hypothetical protein
MPGGTTSQLCAPATVKRCKAEHIRLHYAAAVAWEQSNTPLGWFLVLARGFVTVLTDPYSERLRRSIRDNHVIETVIDFVACQNSANQRI